MSRIKLTRDEVFDAIDCGVIVDRDTWRHGTIDTTVFKRDGKFYCITVEVHSTEGVQVYGDHVTAFEVRREPKPRRYVTSRRTRASSCGRWE